VNRTIELNGAHRTTEARTLAELLLSLGRAERAGVAVARNDEVVPRGRWASTPVEAGDVIEIVEATQGG